MSLTTVAGVATGGTSILSSIAGKLVMYALIFSTIGGLILYGKMEHAEAVAAKVELSQAVQVNKQNVVALATLQKQSQASVAAATNKATTWQKYATQLSQIQKDNTHATNGPKPVSPVVGDTLGKLLNAAGSDQH